MGIADAELGSVAVELFDFVLKLCEDFCDAFAGCIIDDRHKFIAAVSSYEMLRGNRVSPHVIFGQEMLKPRDGSEKDEGELTGAKRLIRHLKKRHGHFADVIVADALYLNAPFINTLKECGLETVIRLKDERRLLFQDAESMFQRDEGRKRSFRKGKKSIEVWDLSGFEIDFTWTIS